MRRDTNTSRTLTDSGKIIAISIVPLALSGIMSFYTWVYAAFFFDEMHIISTDSELRPRLTLVQVTKDIFVTFNIWAFFTAVLVLIIGAIILSIIQAAKDRIPKSTYRTAFRLAFACWLVLCCGPLLAAVQYYLEMRERLN